jgi:hypothetical protein
MPYNGLDAAKDRRASDGRTHVMKALSVAILLNALLMAGCAGVETGPSAADVRERMLCEESRGPGVWVAAAGACIRGGGGP